MCEGRGDVVIVVVSGELSVPACFCVCDSLLTMSSVKGKT